MGQCKQCRQEIMWITNPANKYIPVNEGLVPYWTDPKGSDEVIKDDGSIISCRLKGEGKASGLARIPHWKTCTGKK